MFPNQAVPVVQEMNFNNQVTERPNIMLYILVTDSDVTEDITYTAHKNSANRKPISKYFL